VIEILSASTQRHDRGAKFRAYERAGVRELWLIDPYGPDGTQFFQLQRGEYVEIAADENHVIHAVTVPDFWVDVRWLWPDDRFVTTRQALSAILTER
jgi:Uma2 family endonuclease